MRRRRREEDAEPMTQAEAAIMLAGWGAHAPGDESGDDTDLWLWNDASLIEAWQQHEDYLRQLAATWGWRPECALRRFVEGGALRVWSARDGDERLFYAEAVARSIKGQLEVE
jgi:hypothetical protein